MPQRPIELHYWPTPNGHKITIMLEECGLPYEIKPVNIGKGDQFKPEFLAIAPNNRMPAIVDPDGPDGKPISIFESGAILQYLGRKTGKFYPEEERARVEVEQWLYWQMANLGPNCGQAHHFRNYAQEKIKYAIDRYTNEVNRLYGVMDTRLEDRPYLAGDYSIADMASYPVGAALQEPRPGPRRVPEPGEVVPAPARPAGGGQGRQDRRGAAGPTTTSPPTRPPSRSCSASARASAEANTGFGGSNLTSRVSQWCCSKD